MYEEYDNIVYHTNTCTCTHLQGLKKPYNPIIGETFRCMWPNAENDSKTFYIGEQVSHHPPVSAFYVSNRKDGYVIGGSILAKSKLKVPNGAWKAI